MRRSGSSSVRKQEEPTAKSTRTISFDAQNTSALAFTKEQRAFSFILVLQCLSLPRHAFFLHICKSLCRFLWKTRSLVGRNVFWLLSSSVTGRIVYSDIVRVCLPFQHKSLPSVHPLGFRVAMPPTAIHCSSALSSVLCYISNHMFIC